MRWVLFTLKFIFVFGFVIGAPGKYTREEEDEKSTTKFSATTSVQGSIENDHQYNKRIYETDSLSNLESSQAADFNLGREAAQTGTKLPHLQAPCSMIARGCNSITTQTYRPGSYPCASSDCSLLQTYNRKKNLLDKSDIDQPGAHISGENPAITRTGVFDNRLHSQTSFNKIIPPPVNTRINYPVTTIVGEDQRFNHNPNLLHSEQSITVVPSAGYSSHPSQYPNGYIGLPMTYPDGEQLHTVIQLNPLPPPQSPPHTRYIGSNQHPNNYQIPNEPCNDPTNHCQNDRHHALHSYPHVHNHRILDHHLKISSEYKETGQHTGHYQTNHQFGFGSGYGGGYNGAFNKPIF